MTTPPDRPGVPLLEIRDLTHRPGGAGRSAAVLHEVSMRMRDGELVALAGRSGSGKSTLCHLIAGLEQPTEGTVVVSGCPATSLRDWSVVSLLPQRLALAPELTVGQNASLPAWLRGMPARADLLEMLGLAHLATRLVTQTSLGEQQRTAIARTLALGPRLAVLDEPTGHQDDDHVERVIDVLRAINRDGCAILVATHDERILEVCHRVIHLDCGRVVSHVAPQARS